MLLSDFHSYLSNISEYEYKIKIILCCADCHTIEKVHIPLNSEALCTTLAALWGDHGTETQIA